MGKLNKKITRKLSSKFHVSKFTCELMEESKPTNTPTNNINNSKKDEAPVPITTKGGDLTVSKRTKAKTKTKSQAKKTEEPKTKRNSKFYMKCAKARQEKGMILLPAKIETKIYKLKKALQKKGLSGDEIKDIIRKKRREEELKMRKDMKQCCFKCREPGHTLANCPLAGEEATDICYFCGSGEHRLCDCVKYKMTAKKDSLPFAKCFICKKSGHLTRSCKQNENGVFPKGGKCILCGSVNHLVKDCSKNEQKEEKEVILQTYGDISQSVDADDFMITQPVAKSVRVSNNKKVKF